MTENHEFERMREVAKQFTYLPYVHGVSIPACDNAEAGAGAQGFAGNGALPSVLSGSLPTAPDLAACEALWDKYAVPPHIREHCRQVARVLMALGDLAISKGARLDRPTLLAGGLLHDLAKMYTVNYPGDHAQVGAALVLRETKNYRVAQMVYHHVDWPWEADVDNDIILHVLLLIYADKRVMHDQIVSLEQRFRDLNQRYGKTERSRAILAHSHYRGLEIEKALSKRLEVKIDEYPVDSGRLV
ncbi:HDIG domain-containing protein [Desulfovibrio sp. OttesenSCG-928-C06]|nr:HDIG domain-containing protein [Desulfovibrio sp. OttesenSCG-928-C06]